MCLKLEFISLYFYSLLFGHVYTLQHSILAAVLRPYCSTPGEGSGPFLLVAAWCSATKNRSTLFLVHRWHVRISTTGRAGPWVFGGNTRKMTCFWGSPFQQHREVWNSLVDVVSCGILMLAALVFLRTSEKKNLYEICFLKSFSVLSI